MQIVSQGVPPLVVRTAMWGALSIALRSTDQTVRNLWLEQHGLNLNHVPDAALWPLCAEVERLTGLRVSLARSSFRIQRHNSRCPLPWHQDYEQMGGTSAVLAGMVCWVPCDPLDGSRPSVEVAEPVPPQPHQEHPNHFLGFVQQDGWHGTVLSGLAVGDAVLFSPLAPHRTVLQGRRSRASFDFRCYPKDARFS